MGQKEAYAVLVAARCGTLDDGRRLEEAQRVTGYSVANVHEGPSSKVIGTVYGDDEDLTDQRGVEAISA